MKYTIHQGNCNSLYGMPLHVAWHPTFHCNYHCSYCNQKRPKGQDWLSLVQCQKMFDNLLELNRDDYLICIAGGEPFVFPYLAEVIEHIGSSYKNKLDNIYIISNGSRNIELYRKLAKISTKIALNLFISIHTDHAELDDINFMISELSDNICLNFSLMFNPAKREKTKKFHEALLNLREIYPFNVAIRTLRELDNGDIIDRRYNHHDFEWLKYASKEFTKIHNASSKKFCAKGWPVAEFVNKTFDNGQYCYNKLQDLEQSKIDCIYDLKNYYCVLGTHQISINPDGRVHNAICDMATISSKPLYEDNPYRSGDFVKIVKCAKTSCGCRSNDYLQKYLDFDEASDFLKYFTQKQARRLVENIQECELAHNLCSQKLLLDKCSLASFPLDNYVDEEYYFNAYPDVASSGMSAVEHFQKFGWQERRNPNSWFNTSCYLSQFEHPELVTENPLAHYILRGCLEGKLPDVQRKL